MYNAYVTRIKNLHKHPNADRLQIGECFGNAVVVSMEYEDNQLGVYFPSDGQLSVEFAEANNLLRKKDENGNNIGGYMDPDKRNVTAIRLRGEKSDGLFLPLKSLETFGDISILREGDRIDNFNGHEICCKYIPKRNVRRGHSSEGNRTRKKKVSVAPLFAEHADTEQLAYNLGAFKPGDEIEITLKMHGTSQRTGYLPVLKGYKRTIWDKLFRKEGTPIYDWGYVSGTRRVVLDDYEGGYYGSNEFRETHSKVFEGKLMKGETVYYEVVGFTHTGAPIMGNGNNEKVGKDFVKQYGKETVFSYGCDCAQQAWKEDRGQDGDKPESDIYVYRMTITNEDGFVVEYTPDFMRYRCEQMGIKCVPVFTKFIIHDYDLEVDTRTPGEIVKDVAERYYDGPDPIGKTHTREGVVVRIINRPKFCAYKHKNFEFKVLEGIIKDTASVPDMEEVQDTTE
jgi:hypothetical protein